MLRATAEGFALAALAALAGVIIGHESIGMGSTTTAWAPVLAGLLNTVLLYCSSAEWLPSSWWASCGGARWGQLPVLATCTFTILPSILSSWLLWQPPQCTPLPCLLLASVTVLAFTSLLFWGGALPLLPRADVTAGCARAGCRRSAVLLLQAATVACNIYLAASDDGVGCSALTGPPEATALLVDELRSQTPQGMASASALLTQLVLATLAVHVVLDEPGGTAAAAPAPGDAGARIGRLWGSLD